VIEHNVVVIIIIHGSTRSSSQRPVWNVRCAMLSQANRICILTVHRYSGGYISTYPPPGFYSYGASPQSALVPPCHSQNHTFGLPVRISVATVPLYPISNPQRAPPNLSLAVTHFSEHSCAGLSGRWMSSASGISMPRCRNHQAGDGCSNYGQAAVIEMGSDSCGVGQQARHAAATVLLTRCRA
jgi:hypothetical protein